MDHTAWTILVAFLETTEIAKLLRTCKHSKVHYLIIKVEITKRKLQLEQEVADIAEHAAITREKLHEYLTGLQREG
jgi:hypothetical protein